MVWWGGEEDVDEAHAWVGRVRLDPGEYRFLAIARDDRHVSGARSLADPNVAVADWEWTGWTAGTTRLEDATLACARTSPLAATELFCGSTSDPVRVDGSRTAFRCAIGLERAVAGILLYVEHIPATIRACVHDASGTHHTRDVPVTGLAVVRGGRLSDRVRLWDRSAVAGTLTSVSAQTAAPDCPNPPLPAYSLLEVAIPDHAEVRDGIYTNLTPGNTAHPDALLQGGFVLPQAEPEEAGSDSGEHYDRSLYLVFLGEEGAGDASPSSGGRLGWRPTTVLAIRFVSRFWPTTSTALDGGPSPPTERASMRRTISRSTSGRRAGRRSRSASTPSGTNTTEVRSAIRRTE